MLEKCSNAMQKMTEKDFKKMFSWNVKFKPQIDYF